MSQKENKDPFFRLKYIAYCRNYMAPDTETFAELLNYARNYLCLHKNVLYNDPLWNTYTDEGIMVEFYSVRMHKDEEFREEVEGIIKGKGNTDEDRIDWMEKRQREEDEKREARLKKLKEEIEIDYSSEDEG